MDSEDGQVFVKNLAHFVRTHERALANALQTQRTRTGNGSASQQVTAGSSTAISLTEALSRPYLSFSQNLKPAKLTLTPHHLYYLLTAFEDLGVDVGPTNVRLENLHSEVPPSNYVSFLGNAPKSKGRQSDADSLRSVSSVRSVMSSVSSLWSSLSLTNQAAKEEKRLAQYQEDIKYLYSCFTKIPALKLAPDHRARLISGYEVFPFDTAVPLFVFKNLSALEICDLDFRQFYGWDRLAEQLRSLTVKRASIDDPLDLLQNIVLDDIEKRRKRSSKTQVPTTPSTPGAPWPSTSSPRSKQSDLLARSYSTPYSPIADQRRGSVPMARVGSSGSQNQLSSSRQRSNSPVRPQTSRHSSLRQHKKSSVAQIYRRSSGSSGSSTHEITPRHSMTDLLALGILPPNKWRFLRHLSLAENGLTSLTADSLKPVAGSLQSLDLSGNLFKQVPDGLSSLTHLRALNLCNNMIDDLRSLAKDPLPAVTTLNLRSNRLSSLVGIEKIPTLERIDLRDNRLRDPAELRRLTNAMELIDVYVIKNPFMKSHSNYRVEIFNAFRDTPGHRAEITIDTLPPTYNEKKQLHDKAPEPSPVAIVPPSPEDDDEPEAMVGADDELAELEPSVLSSQGAQGNSKGHRRSTSDMGPQSTQRRKKGTRRRIVELSQQEATGSFPREPSLLHSAELPPQTPTDVDEPPTPSQTLYHTARTTQPRANTPPQRPKLDTVFTNPSPAAAPKIRDPSDDDDSPIQSPQGLDINSDLYRQKMEALKQDLGPNWLTALNDRRANEPKRNGRSPSPSSQTTAVGPRQQSRDTHTGGRKLG
ncbi:hypothetical protein D0863_05554 [Hortaea werneckii]|uniref:Leucine-rich repeat-containing protein n=1 Tax=Hortaea werneckii TaxID=91943 RepID=A0A3M7E2C2_HORWE|nr:hypothetical protein D0863_05554 [Hortaea werneckii]